MKRTAKPARSRRGVGVLIAVVTFSIAVVVVIAMAQTLLMRRSSLGLDAWQAQADCLARSGAERAAARLAVDPDYAGETWRLSADDLTGDSGANVRIEVGPAAGGVRVATVTADYPEDPVHRVRSIKTVEIAVAERDTVSAAPETDAAAPVN